MAGVLGMDVVAEGVETEAQKQALLADGCRVAQGYLFAKPLVVGEIEVFFEEGCRVDPSEHKSELISG